MVPLSHLMDLHKLEFVKLTLAKQSPVARGGAMRRSREKELFFLKHP